MTAELIQEYIACAQDVIYYGEKYCEVFDKISKKIIPLKIFPKQKELLFTYSNNRLVLTTKPRQAGVSTMTQLFCAHSMIFATKKSPQKILVIANKQKTAQEFLKGVKKFLDSRPAWTGLKLVTDSASELGLDNGSTFKAVGTSEDALRGYAPTIFIMDEAAFIERGDEVWGAAQPAIGTTGKGFLISTPNGYDKLYYPTYRNSIEKKNDFMVFEMKWYEDPRYNKDLKWVKADEEIVTDDLSLFKGLVADGYKPTSPWYIQSCRDLNDNEIKISQELDVSFVGSGDNVVKDEYIVAQEKENVKPLPIETGNFDNNVWIYAKPEQDKQYIAGADISRGDSADFSTLVIFCVETGEEVLEYQGKLPPDKMGELIHKWCTEYQAYTVVDVTGGMGQATIIKLIDLEFQYLHYSDPRTSKMVKATMSKYKKNDDLYPGFIIGNNRTLVIQELERCIRMGEIQIRSPRFIGELRTFIYKNGRPDHMVGYHDDILIAAAMALFVLQHSFRSLKRYNSQTVAMLNSYNVSNTTQFSVGNPSHDISEYSWLFPNR